jgi:hypothetical protein
MNYAQDVITLRHGKIDDGTIRFSSPRAAERSIPVLETAT